MVNRIALLVEEQVDFFVGVFFPVRLTEDNPIVADKNKKEELSDHRLIWLKAMMFLNM